VTSCVRVAKETAERREGATFCAIWLALPILSVCSPPTSLASGSPRILPMMTRPPRSLRRRRPLGRRGQEAVCGGDGEQRTCAAQAVLSWTAARHEARWPAPTALGVRIRCASGCTLGRQPAIADRFERQPSAEFGRDWAEGEGEMTLANQHRHDRRSWKDSPKAKTIARTIASLLIAGLIATLALATAFAMPGP
jgi:hypothetical protein